jgi:hypothetical protein
VSERLPQEIREIAAEQVERLADVVAALSDADLVAPTLCDGWLVAHLLAHVRLGLAEHATSFAEPAGPGEVTDRDYVSYWRDWPPGNRPATYDGVRFHWASGSVYATADGLRGHFADTARPPAWDPATYVLKGAGRLALDDAEREFLGERAARFPALG